MFYCRRSHVGFAHYPKTAGTSVQYWFRRAFPDGGLLDDANPHLTVAASLAMLPPPTPPAGWRKLLAAVVRRPAARPPMIVGVIREPFEMLASLYDYWRRHPFPVEPTAAFIQAARRGTFATFLRMAVVDGCMPTYEVFFDVGGPAWPRTRLIDFSSLGSGLERVARECGLRRPPALERRNAATGRDLDGYRRQAGDLVAEVRRHFRWYYDHGLGFAVGRAPQPARAA